MSEAKKMYAKANAGSVKTNGAVNHLPAALAHDKAGLFIFPILEGTKDQPLIKQWGIRASCDAAQITEWWTRWPQANIGLACMKSGIAVIDSDVPNGEATLQWLADLEDKILSPTKMARSPRGGIHRFYRGRIATTAGKKPMRCLQSCARKSPSTCLACPRCARSRTSRQRTQSLWPIASPSPSPAARTRNC